MSIFLFAKDIIRYLKATKYSDVCRRSRYKKSTL